MNDEDNKVEETPEGQPVGEEVAPTPDVEVTPEVEEQPAEDTDDAIDKSAV
jgi:hypothetical protein